MADLKTATTTWTANNGRVASENLAYFNTIPWCKKLLDAPDVTILHDLPRRGTPDSTTDDSFWIRTLGTPETVRGVLTIVPSQHAAEYPRITSSISLYSLGSLVAGHHGMAHGGMIATLLDDATGKLVNTIEDFELEENPKYARKSTFTLKMETTYRKPVPAPGVVLVRSILDCVEGKKRYVTGTLENEEGVVLCEAKTVFLILDKDRPSSSTAKL